MTTSAASGPTESRRFLFLLASARQGGNAERLARVAAAALPAQVAQRWIRLDDMQLAPFHDLRHDPRGYSAPEGQQRVLVEATLDATDLVIAAPLYWYSLPASAKLYLDYWSAWMRVAELRFQERMNGKRLWGLTVTSDDDDSTTAALIETLRLSARYLQMDWRGVLVGHGNRPGDIERDSDALLAATALFSRDSRTAGS